MRAYESTLGNFYNDINRNLIVDKIKKQMHMDFGESQIRAFKNSLPALKNALEINNSLPLDCDVAIEMVIPLTNKRMDFVIAGSDENNKDHVIIIELKQWSNVKHTDMPDIVRVEYGKHYQDEVHPSWQAYSYKTIIKSFNEYVNDHNVDIKSCAFLHNFPNKYVEEIRNPIYEEGINLSYPYIETEYETLSNFISKYIKKKSDNKLLYEISDGKIKPSKILCDALGKVLNGNKEFELIDEQRIVYSNLLNNIKKDIHSKFKHVYIVKGGMGTGKTLVAIQLLQNLIREQKANAFFVAKSSYLKASFVKKLTKDVPDFKFLRTLFRGSGDFINSTLNEFDCLLVDEAHRLTRKTKRGHLYFGENQIKEIIHASKVTVFFIDEDQSIDLKDFGTIKNIEKYANEEHAIIDTDPKYELKSQFRCNGSDEYLSFLKSILYNEEYIPSQNKIDYDIKIFDKIEDLYAAIVEKNKIKTSRMLSGDVFEWKSMKDKTAIDINIDNFHAQWNKKNTFAVDKDSINQVGCIHTSQGMEFDYVGLIVGNDLIYRNGKVETDYTKHPAKSGEFKRPYYPKRIFDEDLPQIDRIIRNTYKVLFTRGQKGTYLYVMDGQLKEYLKKRLKEIHK